MDVIVDADRCQGHARCSLICPGVFDHDDGGFAVVRSAHVPPEYEKAVRDAADNCPEQAIGMR